MDSNDGMNAMRLVRPFALLTIAFVLLVAGHAYSDGHWNSFATWLFASLILSAMSVILQSFMVGPRKMALGLAALVLAVLGAISAVIAGMQQ